MMKPRIMILLFGIVVLGVIAAACSGGAASAPAPNEPTATAAGAPSTKAAEASEEEDEAAAEKISLSAEEQKKAQEIGEGLSVIESIPDSVVEQGPDAASRWLKEHTSSGVTTKGVVGCASAIGVAIVMNFPIMKIFKIRAILKGLGGAGKFASVAVKLFRRYKERGYSAKEALKKAVSVASKHAGSDAKDLLLDLLGLGSVFSACFE